MEQSNSGMYGHGMPAETHSEPAINNVKIEGKNETEIRRSKNCEIFTLVKQDEKIHIIVGEYKAVKRSFDNFKQAEQYIGTKPYELIFNTFQILTNYAEAEKKKSQKVSKPSKKNTQSIKQLSSTNTK